MEKQRDLDGKKRRTPTRMCLGCRTRRPKGELKRFIFSSAGALQEDARQVMPGRGYYVCAAGGCEEKWLRRAARRQKG